MKSVPVRLDHDDRIHRPPSLTDQEIIGIARRQGPQGSLAMTWVRQQLRERAIRRRHIEFRCTDDGRVRTAYGAMRIDEFADINSLQAWANWRTIPRNLRVVATERAVRVIDLCCGLGQSTEVLAFYLPLGSEILGLDGNPQFVRSAAARPYFHRSGRPAKASFRSQSVLEAFRDESGQLVADSSVDLVHAVGAIGSHFRPESAMILARESARVVRPGGAALLDAGREGTPPDRLRAILHDCGFGFVQKARSCLLDRHWQLCFRRDTAVASDQSAGAPNSCTQ